MSLALIAVPGPSVAFVVSRGVAFGRRAALTTVVGNAAGIYIQVLLVAVGLGAVVERSVAAFTTIKLIGAGYLVWLGIRTIRNRHDLHEAAAGNDPGGRTHSLRVLARDGLVVGVTNPKSMVFFAAILPQFVVSQGPPAGAQMAVLGLVFAAIALVCDSVWAVAAGTVRRWLRGSPEVGARLAVGSGAVMVGLGLTLAMTRAD